MMLPKVLSRMFGYDGATDTGRRRSIVTTNRHEDEIATQQQRKILQANAQDLARNYTLVKWAVAKHLDYVTCFSFQARTGDTAFDAELEEWMMDRTKRKRFDIANRHPLRRAIRLSESCRVLGGDVGWLAINPPGNSPDGGKIQFIESDLIRTPSETFETEKWFNGVLTNTAGATIAYALHKRKGSQYEFTRTVPADSLYLHAWYDGRFDQVRGISPIVSALNWFRDTYEGFEYTLAKLKIAQLFGIKITRSAELGTFGAPTPTLDSDGDGVADSNYKVELGKGPFMLDMEQGDDAAFLESKIPAQETTDFLKLMIHVALRSLDIPYSFFDESFTNFYGSRGGLIQYLKSCRTKIQDNQDVLEWWTDWAIGRAVMRGELDLPGGFDASDIKYEWVQDGVPWWDPAKELKGQGMAVGMCASTYQRVAIEGGSDFYDNVDQNAVAVAYARDKGLELQLPDAAPEPAEVGGNFAQ